MYKRHLKAQFIGLLAFSAMYFGAVAVVIFWPTRAQSGAMAVFLNIDAYLASVVAGYLSAAIIRKRGIVIGAATGVLAACLVGIYHLASGPATGISSGWQFWLASILLGGFGGLVWHLRSLAGKLREPV